MVGNLSLLLLGNLHRFTYWEKIVFARFNAGNDGYVMTLKEERNGRAIRIRKGGENVVATQNHATLIDDFLIALLNKCIFL